MAQVSKEALELRKKYTPSQITAMYEVGLQARIIAACPTVDCCAEIESPTLLVLSEAYPEGMTKGGDSVENTAVTWMIGQMIAVSVFAGVREKMSDMQVRELCQQILLENPNVTMIEFVLFCARLRSGMYEDFYGSVDPMRIIKSFNAFVKDKRRDMEAKLERDAEIRKRKEEEETKKNAISYDEWIASMRARGLKTRKPWQENRDEKVQKSKQESQDRTNHQRKNLQIR